MAEDLIDKPYTFVRLPKARSTSIATHRAHGSPFVRRPWTEWKVERISDEHKRSLVERPSAGRVIWADEHGNLFGTRRLKSPPIGEHYPEYDEYSHYKVRIHGLKDELGLDRAGRASAFMRSHGLATERQTMLHQLDEVVVAGRLMTIADWKEKIVKWGLSVHGRKGGKDIAVGPDQVSAYLRQAEFYVVEAEQQVGERLVDVMVMSSQIDAVVAVRSLAVGKEGIYCLNRRFATVGDLRQAIPELTRVIAVDHSQLSPADIETEFRSVCDFLKTHPDYFLVVSSGKKFRSWLGGIFRWLNQRNQITGEPERFDSSRNEDIAHFFANYLPTQMGKYLARMHGFGLAHGFAGWHNWSLAGTLYDLDSVHGQPLGDQPIAQGDIARDLKLSFFGVENNLFVPSNTLVRITAEKLVVRTYPGFLNQEFSQNLVGLRQEARLTFLAEYIVQAEGSLREANLGEILDKYRRLLDIPDVDFQFSIPGGDWLRLEEILHARLQESDIEG